MVVSQKNGYTIGEIKLFSTLILLVKIDAKVLDSYPFVKAFYDRMERNPDIKNCVLGNGNSVRGVPELKQFFIAPKDV